MEDIATLRLEAFEHDFQELRGERDDDRVACAAEGANPRGQVLISSGVTESPAISQREKPGFKRDPALSSVGADDGLAPVPFTCSLKKPLCRSVVPPECFQSRSRGVAHPAVRPFPPSPRTWSVSEKPGCALLVVVFRLPEACASFSVGVAHPAVYTWLRSTFGSRFVSAGERLECLASCEVGVPQPASCASATRSCGR